MSWICVLTVSHLRLYLRNKTVLETVESICKYIISRAGYKQDNPS